MPPSHSFRLFKPPSTSHAQEVGVSSMHSESGKRLINVIGHLNDIQVLVQFIHNYYILNQFDGIFSFVNSETGTKRQRKEKS